MRCGRVQHPTGHACRAAHCACVLTLCPSLPCCLHSCIQHRLQESEDASVCSPSPPLASFMQHAQGSAAAAAAVALPPPPAADAEAAAAAVALPSDDIDDTEDDSDASVADETGSATGASAGGGNNTVAVEGGWGSSEDGSESEATSQPPQAGGSRGRGRAAGAAALAWRLHSCSCRSPGRINTALPSALAACLLLLLRAARRPRGGGGRRQRCHACCSQHCSCICCFRLQPGGPEQQQHAVQLPGCLWQGCTTGTAIRQRQQSASVQLRQQWHCCIIRSSRFQRAGSGG